MILYFCNGWKKIFIFIYLFYLAYLSVEAAYVEEDGGFLEGHGSLAAGHTGQTVVPAHFLKLLISQIKN
jgi:hypothetical protein